VRSEVLPLSGAAAAAEALLARDVHGSGALQDSHHFLAEVLLTIQNLVAGECSSIWRHEPRSEDGYVLELAIEADGSEAASPPRSGAVGAGAATERWIEVGRAPRDDPPSQRSVKGNAQLDPGERANLLERGVRSYLTVNLSLADIHLGVLIVRLAHQRPVVESNRRLIERLAERVALVLYRARLMLELGEEAIVRERQAAAAKARSEKLAHANALLRETSDRFGTPKDLDAFLGRILLTIHEVVGGHSATIWLADPEEPQHYLLSHIVENGRVITAAQSSHPRREIGTTPTTKSLSDPRLHGPHARPYQFDLAIDGDLLHPDEAAQLLALGVRHLVTAPLSLGDRILGYLTIRLTDDRKVLEEDLDLVQALTGQAAVALNLACLAEGAKQAAVAREREATERTRAEALHRANAVLRAMLIRLSEQEDLVAFIGEALTVCACELGAVGAAVWLKLGPSEHGLLISTEGGVVRAPRDDNYIVRVQALPGLDSELERGRIAFTTLTSQSPDLDGDVPGYHRFVSDQHVITQAIVPMFIGDRWLGAIAFRHASTVPDYAPEKEELALALGNQIALALEMQRLALGAGEAARSEERALAARQRTEAAERTAETLRASLDMLAAEPELERFLGHVLRATNSQLGAASSNLWLHDAESGLNRLHMVCDKGTLTVDPLDQNGNPFVSRPSERPWWRRLTTSRLPMAFDDAPNNPDLKWVRDRMMSEGARALLIVPLIAGPEVLGFVSIRNIERDSWTEEETNLARALGHQATIALQLTRLAAKARAGAVLQERNRLAREIHDTLAQGFAAIRMQLELARGHATVPAEAAEALDAASKIAAENIVEARRSMAVLTTERPSLLTSLSAAVEGARRLGQTQVVAELGVAPEPPPEVAHELMRICQEAMLNAVRHAEANIVRVTLSAFSERGVRVAVADDGKGFDPDKVKKGFGLASLRDRASAIDAELTIVSEPDGGAEVIATWVPD
jgi:signal transduction histidine kinase